MQHPGKTSIEETYYDILSVKEDASYDEIRASYKVAALDSHPDKFNVKHEQTPNHPASHERFLKVQKAWEVLGNPKSRAIYDTELCVSRLDLVLYNEVKLGDMLVETFGEVLELLHPCRCGGTFAISSTELEEMGFSLNENGGLEIRESKPEPASIVLPCFSCSLKIHLIIDVDS